MRVTRNERVLPTDVDGTLVIHIKSSEGICPTELLEIHDPMTGQNILVRKNMPMIRLLREEHARGSYILVWSRGGFEWAYSVVEALKLEDSVDQIMSKPLVYLDDTDVKDWLKDRVFLSPDTIYKTISKEK